MKQLLNIIKPINFDTKDNIYIVGLSLLNGKITDLKIYNKFYSGDPATTRFIRKFWGDFCANCYINNSEWKKIYPGFSGFTLASELDLENESIKYLHAFGFKSFYKKLIFHSFVIDRHKNIIKQQDYEYIKADKITLPPKKISTELVEIQKNQPNKYCYFPKTNKQNAKKIHFDILGSLESRNKKVIEPKIEDKSMLLVNYGMSFEKEKVYLLPKNKNKIQEVLNFVQKLNLDIDGRKIVKNS